MNNDDPLKPQKKPRKPLTYREKMLKGIKPKKYGKTKRQIEKSEIRKNYEKVRDKYIEENPACEICGSQTAPSLHHKAGRTGSLLCDVRYFSNLCMDGSYLDHLYPDANHSHSGGCHPFCHANAGWAKVNGWILRVDSDGNVTEI